MERNKHPALTGIRDHGTVEGCYIETHYRPCKGVLTDHSLRCLRVLADDDSTDIETRVLFDTLIAEGWTPPDKPLPKDAPIPSVAELRELLTPNVGLLGPRSGSAE